MISYFNIYLRDILIYARIGVSQQERKVGNAFLVNLKVKINSDKFKEEDLSSSISYTDLYEVVKSEMSKEIQLLETMAKQISDTISIRWKEVEEIEIRIDKTQPPISGIQGSCGVEYIFKR